MENIKRIFENYDELENECFEALVEFLGIDAESIEREHAQDIMQFLCDENDLMYIINYVNKYEK